MTTPTSRPECEAFQALMPELALGALASDEADSVVGHARTCSDCRRELDAYERVVDGLLVSPAPTAPSPFLRARVMQAAGAGPSLVPVAEPRTGFVAWLRSLVQPAGGFGRLSPAIAALALMIAAGVSFQSFQLQSELRAAQGENQVLRSQIAANQLLVTDALRPGAFVWDLRGTGSAPSARASLYCYPDSRVGLLTAASLPPLPQGEAYQLWLIRDGQRTSGGLMTVDPSGNGVLSVDAPEPFGTYTGVGMTVEPAGGSPSPTGQRVLAAQIY
jgi:anti-sigma-K factor RskA